MVYFKTYINTNMANDRTAKLEQKASRKRTQDLEKLSNELTKAVSKIAKLSSGFHVLGNSTTKYEKALEESIKELLAQTTQYKSEKVKNKLLDNQIEQLTKNMGDASKAYFTTIFQLQRTKGQIKDIEKFRTDLSRLGHDLANVGYNVKPGTSNENAKKMEASDKAFKEFKELSNSHKNLLPDEFITDLKKIQDTSTEFPKKIQELMKKYITEGGSLEDALRDLKDEERLHRNILKENTRAISKSKKTGFIGKTVGGVVKHIPILRNIPIIGQIASGLSGLRLAGGALAAALGSLGRNSLTATLEFNKMTASTGIASKTLREDLSNNAMELGSNFQVMTEYFEHGGAKLLTDNASSYKKASETLYQFSGLFNMSEGQLAGSVFDFADGLYKSNIGMTSALKTTTEWLVGLGNASQLGASRILGMAKESADFSKGFSGVLGPEALKSYTDQLTIIKASLAKDFSSNLAGNITGGIQKAFDEAIHNNNGVMLTMLTGDNTYAKLIKRNPYLRADPKFMAEVLRKTVNEGIIAKIARKDNPNTAEVAQFEHITGMSIAQIRELQKKGYHIYTQKEITNAADEKALQTRLRNPLLQTMKTLNMVSNTATAALIEHGGDFLLSSIATNVAHINAMMSKKDIGETIKESYHWFGKKYDKFVNYENKLAGQYQSILKNDIEKSSLSDKRKALLEKRLINNSRYYNTLAGNHGEFNALKQLMKDVGPVGPPRIYRSIIDDEYKKHDLATMTTTARDYRNNDPLMEKLITISETSANFLEKIHRKVGKGTINPVKK